MLELRDFYPYVMYLRVEHRRLNDALRCISELLNDADQQKPSDSSARLLTMLTRLRTDLAHHFAQEQEGGCIEEAVNRCPSLSPDAKQVQAQHPELLKELDDVIHSVRGTASVAATRQKFAHLAETLKEHESEENRILGMGFGITSDEDK